MKEYQSPSLKETIVWIKDIIAASGDVQSIVSSDDSEGAKEINITTWDDSWN